MVAASTSMEDREAKVDEVAAATTMVAREVVGPCVAVMGAQACEGASGGLKKTDGGYTAQ